MEKRRKKEIPWRKWLAMLVGLTFMLQACQKEPLGPTAKESVVKEDLAVEKKVREFIRFAHALPEVGQEKSSGQTMDPDEAIWLIEASLNYAYVNIQPYGSILACDSLIVSMEKNTNAIQETEAAEAFLSIVSDLTNKAGLLGNVPKALNMLDIKIKTDASNEVQLEVAYTFSEISGPISPFQDFGPQDWWWFGYGMGKCGGYVGWYGKDAATELTTRLNSTLPQPSGHSFYTDLSVVFITTEAFLPLPPGTDPNYCAIPLFYNTNTPPWASTFHYCLSPTEMNYYYFGMYGLLPTYRPLIDPNDPSLGYKNIVACIVIPSELVNSSGFNEISHALMVFYGVSQKASNWEAFYW